MKEKIPHSLSGKFVFLISFALLCLASIYFAQSAFADGKNIGGVELGSGDTIGLPPSGSNTVTVPSSKKGLAWGASNLFWEDYDPLQVSWVYNWSTEISHGDTSSPLYDPNNPFGSQNFDPNVEYIPMIWCDPDSYPLPDGYSGDLLFINEPFFPGQCLDGLSYSEKIDEMSRIYGIISNTYPNANLIGPGINVNKDTIDTQIMRINDWRQQVFEDHGEYPELHGLALHIYNNDWENDENPPDPNDPSPWPPPEDINPYTGEHMTTAVQRDKYTLLRALDLINSWDNNCVDKVTNKSGLECEIWITEFGYCSGFGDSGQAPGDSEYGFGYEDHQDQLINFVNFLEDHNRVSRYSPFFNRDEPYRMWQRYADDLHDNGGQPQPHHNTCNRGRFYDVNNNHYLYSQNYYTACLAKAGDPPELLNDNVLLHSDEITLPNNVEEFSDIPIEDREQYLVEDLYLYCEDNITDSFANFSSRLESIDHLNFDGLHFDMEFKRFGEAYKDLAVETVTSTWDPDE